MKTIILDLDGTCFNVDHRQHLAKAKMWDEFHAACVDDKVNEDVLWVIKASQKSGEEIQIIALTGRNEKFRNLTESQLRCAGFFVDELLMRPDDDYSKDGLMKIALLEKHFGSKEKVLESVVFCLDDRDGVVEAFRNYGLPCWQVRQGTY